MEDHDVVGTKKPMTKTEIIAHLSERTGLAKEQVTGLFGELAQLIQQNLDERGPGVFALPDLLQIKVVRKPATEARKGINPFTKEETTFKAKPATSSIKLVPLKGLKAMLSKNAEE